jgi:unsaturated chondroitin disaccharide hydrolase
MMSPDALLHTLWPKVEHLERVLPAFPHTTQHGRWRTGEHGRWTAGFWIGMLWIGYLHTGGPSFREAALRWIQRLAPRAEDTSTHDMGFLFGPSCITGYRITRDSALRDLALRAARSLATRYRAAPRGPFLPAWDDGGADEYRGLQIVDTVANLPLLAWASQEGGDRALGDVALALGHRIAAEHVRPDGSTIQVVEFDPASGEVIRKGTHQGASPEGCWSRGQAWAAYGFANLFRYTGHAAFRDVAVQCLRWFVDHLPEDGIPFWDFFAPGIPDEPKDAAAAAVAYSGAGLLGDRAAQGRLRRGLAGCVEPDPEPYQGIIRHATADRPRNSAVDESTIYGDYYFVEGLFREARPDRTDVLY